MIRKTKMIHTIRPSASTIYNRTNISNKKNYRLHHAEDTLSIQFGKNQESTDFLKPLLSSVTSLEQLFKPGLLAHGLVDKQGITEAISMKRPKWPGDSNILRVKKDNKLYCIKYFVNGWVDINNNLNDKDELANITNASPVLEHKTKTFKTKDFGELTYHFLVYPFATGNDGNEILEEKQLNKAKINKMLNAINTQVLLPLAQQGYRFNKLTLNGIVYNEETNIATLTDLDAIYRPDTGSTPEEAANKMTNHFRQIAFSNTYAKALQLAD